MSVPSQIAEEVATQLSGRSGQGLIVQFAIDQACAAKDFEIKRQAMALRAWEDDCAEKDKEIQRLKDMAAAYIADRVDAACAQRNQRIDAMADLLNLVPHDTDKKWPEGPCRAGCIACAWTALADTE